LVLDLLATIVGKECLAFSWLTICLKSFQHAFCSTPYFEPFAIPLLLDKLSSSLPLAKVSSLTYCVAPSAIYHCENSAQNFSLIFFTA